MFLSTYYKKPPLLIVRFFRFLAAAYRNHWVAAPLGALAALISTLSAATLMIPIEQLLSLRYAMPNVIIANAIIGPLLAYALYLAVYYTGMFWRERASLIDENGNLERTVFKDWCRTVRYDYLAHLPSDCYLISLAAITQATLQFNGITVFFALLTSQFVDDLITFLKEPAIWAGASSPKL